MSTTKKILDSLQEKMNQTLTGFKGTLAKVRTGRASPALLDAVRVDYYGTPTPLSQIASVSCHEPRLIVIQPWEPNIIPAVEKGILIADLGLNPQNDGKVVRVPLPPLTEERRKDLVKVIKKQGEEAKIALRTERRQANDELKKMEKDKAITQDELKKSEELVQKKTDDFVSEIDKVLVTKEKEIMSV